MFGGLGTRYGFGFGQTEQYLAPTVALNTPSGFTYKFSPEFGLNDNSAGVLWRFGVSYEISQVPRLVPEDKMKPRLLIVSALT